MFDGNIVNPIPNYYIMMDSDPDSVGGDPVFDGNILNPIPNHYIMMDSDPDSKYW